MKKKMLFVAYLDKHPDEGFSYVIELAKVMNEDLMVFLLREESLWRSYENGGSHDVLTEPLEVETQAQGITATFQETPETKKQLAGIVYKCKKSGIKVELYSTNSDVISVIENYFRHKNGIDIVLLSPNITEHGHFSQRTLRKLSQSVARPIVTMAKQTSMAPI
jgi:hypothetical protein